MFVVSRKAHATYYYARYLTEITSWVYFEILEAASMAKSKYPPDVGGAGPGVARRYKFWAQYYPPKVARRLAKDFNVTSTGRQYKSRLLDYTKVEVEAEIRGIMRARGLERRVHALRESYKERISKAGTKKEANELQRDYRAARREIGEKMRRAAIVERWKATKQWYEGQYERKYTVDELYNNWIHDVLGTP